MPTFDADILPELTRGSVSEDLYNSLLLILDKTIQVVGRSTASTMYSHGCDNIDKKNYLDQSTYNYQ